MACSMLVSRHQFSCRIDSKRILPMLPYPLNLHPDKPRSFLLCSASQVAQWFTLVLVSAVTEPTSFQLGLVALRVCHFKLPKWAYTRACICWHLPSISYRRLSGSIYYFDFNTFNWRVAVGPLWVSALRWLATCERVSGPMTPFICSLDEQTDCVSHTDDCRHFHVSAIYYELWSVSILVICVRWSVCF